MRRVVLESADLSGEAIEELKQWLGITRDDEDANLVALLKASLDMCEGFLGQRPLAEECEEVIALCGNRANISAQPVTSVLGAEMVDDAGERTPLLETDYTLRIDADGRAQVQLMRSVASEHLAVRFTAGLANIWSDLPGALRHGIIRLAAFHYRERDSAKTMPPPASVTALWRPWRQVRVA